MGGKVEVELGGSEVVPLWLKSLKSPVKVTAVRDAPLRYSTNVFDGWKSERTARSTPTTEEHIFRGPSLADYFVASFLSNAVPGHRMLSWIDASIRMTGFPCIHAPASSTSRPTLLILRDEGECRLYRERCGVDEMHSLTGLARYGEEVGRFYIVLLRARTFAWKFFLSMASGAGSGDEIPTLRDDHRRAAVVFGALKVLTR